MNEHRILTISGVEVLWDGVRATWKAGAAVDVDGSGSSHGDPCFQPDTSLHRNGTALNADRERYIVVPPQVCITLRGIVLGCQAFVTWRGSMVTAVVGDIGPRSKIGELSYACAKALGMNPSPIIGGVDAREVHYEIRPGVPAQVDGIIYKLQRYAVAFVAALFLSGCSFGPVRASVAVAGRGERAEVAIDGKGVSVTAGADLNGQTVGGAVRVPFSRRIR